jgi:ParB family chromosome partitioning protein
MRKPVERKMGAIVANLATTLTADTGLGQMMYGQAADVQRISFIPLDEITPNPQQPRKIFDTNSIEELSESIKRHGVLQPIAVMPNPHSPDPKWMIVAGERRWRASKLASLGTIPAIVTSKDPEEVALVENIQREDLHPIEIARGIQKLSSTHKYGQNEVAAVLGKSRGDVSKLLKILTLPTEFLDFAIENGVGRRALYEIATQEDPARTITEMMNSHSTESSDESLAPIKSPSPRRGRLSNADSVSRAISSFSQKLKKVEKIHLSSDQHNELLTLRRQINQILGDSE